MPTAKEVYYGSNGGATRSFCKRLEKLSHLGRIAAALFRAQKASTRAKVYHGGFRSNGGEWNSYRELAYERKGECLCALCELLAEDSCGLRWGWRDDPKQSHARYVLYVELPEGQVSFHSTERHDGPEHEGDWDGQRKSEERILEFADAVLAQSPEATGSEEPSSRPRRCTQPELAKFRVEILDKKNLQLRCLNCGQVWSPLLLAGGRLPKGYWKCPTWGCK